MLNYAIVFLVLAILSGVLGFGAVLPPAIALAAKVGFFAFIALFLLTLLWGPDIERDRNGGPGW